MRRAAQNSQRIWWGQDRGRDALSNAGKMPALRCRQEAWPRLRSEIVMLETFL
jgi:hypothetical protein